MTMQNASGAMWEVTMFDPTDKSTMSVGKIFFVDSPLGLPTSCRALGQSQSPPTPGLSSYTFLEYFEAPFDFTTIATWSNMTAFSPAQNKAFKVPNIAKDCGGLGFIFWTHRGIETCAGGDPIFWYWQCSCEACFCLCVSFAIRRAVCERTALALFCNLGCGRTYGKPPSGAFLDTSRRCVPPECDDLELTMMCGPYVKPTRATVAANPGCLKADRPQQDATVSSRLSLRDCWRDGPPSSLDECFARP